MVRGLEILKCFQPGERLLGNKDLARRTGIPKPTVSRLTYTLTRMGYLNYSESLGKYQLGTAVLSLGYSLLSNMDVLKVARPLMQELADYSHTAVGVGARDRLGMVYLKGCYSPDATIYLQMEVGSCIPIATTSMGRALLCGLPEKEREYLLDHIRKENPQEWPSLKAGIEQSLKDYQDWGFVFSNGNWRKDVNAVAVPMLPVAGSVVMSFNCAAPSFVLRRHMLEDDIGPRLVHMVRTIEREVTRY
ncbi:MAG: IclR family transcriptional regulator [Geobacter sp.]|nr:MAG: IclR family transcriptional regulator [Geobacter sp.]